MNHYIQNILTFMKGNVMNFYVFESIWAGILNGTVFYPLIAYFTEYSIAAGRPLSRAESRTFRSIFIFGIIFLIIVLLLSQSIEKKVLYFLQQWGIYLFIWAVVGLIQGIIEPLCLQYFGYETKSYITISYTIGIILGFILLIKNYKRVKDKNTK